MKNTLEAILNECETLEEARAQAKMWLENKIQEIALHPSGIAIAKKTVLKILK